MPLFMGDQKTEDVAQLQTDHPCKRNGNTNGVEVPLAGYLQKLQKLPLVFGELPNTASTFTLLKGNNLSSPSFYFSPRTHFWEAWPL
jgi:hypothetical protein